MLAFQEPGCGGSVTWWRFSGGRASSDLSAPSIGVTVSNYLCSAWFVPVDFVARISPASSRAWFAPVKRDGGPSFIVSSHRCIVSFSHLSSDRQLRKRTTNRATGIECRNMSSCTVNLLFNHTREMKLQWHCFIILYSVPHIRETRTRAHTRTHTHTHREREREREREKVALFYEELTWGLLTSTRLIGVLGEIERCPRPAPCFWKENESATPSSSSRSSPSLVAEDTMRPTIIVC